MEDKIVRLKKISQTLEELDLELEKLSNESKEMKKNILNSLDKQKLLSILNYINNIKD